MLKRFKIFNLTVILTDEDVLFVEDGEEVRLSEETGWWDEKGRIWVWVKDLKWYEKLGICVHEFVECVLVRKLKMRRDRAHGIANAMEKVLSLGRSKIY